MSWQIPNWWAFLLLALASFRWWRLLAEDRILDRPRRVLLSAFPSAEYWLTCPWCSGAAWAVGWWLGWVISHHWAAVAAAPFAISATVGIVAANFDPD